MRPIHRLARPAGALLAAAGGLLVVVVAGIAIAKSFTLGLRHNVDVGGKHETIAVSKGLSVYYLSPETTKHLLCTAGCLSAWPVVTVTAHGGLTKAPGVKGKLGRFKRGHFYQLTWNGHPLYTFTGDNGKSGVANGNGISPAAGEVWHVIRAAGQRSTSTTTTTTSTSTSWSTSTTTTSTSTTSTYSW